jgi:hypothetical protein
MSFFGTHRQREARMLRKLVAVGLLCTAMNTLAGFFDGNDLVKDMREWEKFERKDPSVSSLVAGNFMGYVAGVADVYDEISICPPETSTVRQLSTTVARFLNANPARWAEPADVLVADALKKSFPCKTK